MLKIDCASCGAPVQFRSKASVFAVCSYCKSTLVRQDMNLELVGKMADLKYDVTPFQIGTSGKFNGKAFEVIGRLQIAYSEGYWNEWYCIFNDGDTGWLAEAQGFLAMCFTKQGWNIPDKSILAPGKQVDLDPKKEFDLFQVEEGRPVRCTYSEGELPMNAARGRESFSVDLATVFGEMATIEFASDETRLFVGKYQDFDEFEFKNLRRIDGW